MTDAPSLPAAVERAAFRAELDKLRAREGGLAAWLAPAVTPTTWAPPATEAAFPKRKLPAISLAIALEWVRRTRSRQRGSLPLLYGR